METIFSQDQIESLKVWKNSLQTEVALGWMVEEDKEFIEAGFEYVTDRDGVKIYRKRK